MQFRPNARCKWTGIGKNIKRLRIGGYESGCLITSPDGDIASGYQINEKIEDLERKVRTLTRQNQELKDIIEKAVCENDSQGA